MIRLPPPVRDSREAELAAFDDICQRLGGFDGRIEPEWVDGWLTAVATLPQRVQADAWLPLMAGDAFSRAFADPEDETRARAALQGRLDVLRQQLDGTALDATPDEIRLAPLMLVWTDADRAQVLAEHDAAPPVAAAATTGAPEAESAEAAAARREDLLADLHTGSVWTLGFFDALEQLPAQTAVLDDDDEELQAALLDQVAVLGHAPGSEAFREIVQRFHPKAGDAGPQREVLIDLALLAVQDLKLFWLDRQPRPETRRVEAAPGRNDPCPCGSGRKFKKCHGAAA